MTPASDFNFEIPPCLYLSICRESFIQDVLLSKRDDMVKRYNTNVGKPDSACAAVPGGELKLMLSTVLEMSFGCIYDCVSLAQCCGAPVRLAHNIVFPLVSLCICERRHDAVVPQWRPAHTTLRIRRQVVHLTTVRARRRNAARALERG